MIKYRPNLDSILWSRKCQEYYETIDDLKAAIADHHTKFCRFIGKPEKAYKAQEVELVAQQKPDKVMYWRNYCSVVLDGRIIGFCGE